MQNSASDVRAGVAINLSSAQTLNTLLFAGEKKVQLKSGKINS
jgi:hypothetical protein